LYSSGINLVEASKRYYEQAKIKVVDASSDVSKAAEYVRLMEVKAVTRNKKEATSFPRSIGDILMKARTRSSSLFYFTSCRAMPASYVHLWEGGLHSAVQQKMMFVDYNL